MTLRAMIERERARTSYTLRDATRAAAVVLALTPASRILGRAGLQNGWPVLGGLLLQFGFLGAFTLSMPLWITKGQPWKFQAALVGTTLAFLIAIYLV